MEIPSPQYSLPLLFQELRPKVMIPLQFQVELTGFSLILQYYQYYTHMLYDYRVYSLSGMIIIAERLCKLG